MGAGLVVPERLTLAEAKALVPEGRWQATFDERFARAEPKSRTVSKRHALEVYAKAERRRERFEGRGCVAENRWREYRRAESREKKKTPTSKKKLRRRYEDPESGARYQIDRATGKSVWADETDGAGAPRAFTREHDDQTGHYYFANGTGAPHWETPRWDAAAAPKGDGGGAAREAEVWHEEFDEYHGQAYYVNAVTGESRWTRPPPPA